MRLALAISFSLRGFVTPRQLYRSGSLNFKHDRNSDVIIQSRVHAYEHGREHIPCTCLSGRLYASFCPLTREALAPPVSVTFPETIMATSTETLPSFLDTFPRFAFLITSLLEGIHAVIKLQVAYNKVLLQLFSFIPKWKSLLRIFQC